MEYANTEYGQSVGLKTLCIDILKKWRMLLLAALIGCVLLGGYQLAIRLITGEQSVLTQEERKAYKTALEDNEEAIERRKNSIEDQNDLITELRKSKKKYEALLEQATAAEVSSAEVMADIVGINEQTIEKQNQIISAFTQIQALEDEIESLETTNKEYKTRLEETTPVVQLQSILLRAVFGGILGIFIVCVWVAICWARDKTLKSGSEMEERFAIPVLGAPAASAEPDGHNGKIDRWIAKLEASATSEDPEQEYALAAAKLQLLTEPGQRITLTGPVARERLEQVFTALQKNLPADACSLFVADNPLHHPDAMLQLQNSMVLLVVATHDSNTPEIQALTEFLQLGKVAVIGAVVL